jgi:hypothetical protein
VARLMMGFADAQPILRIQLLDSTNRNRAVACSEEGRNS